MWSLMTRFPTFNRQTDITCVMCVEAGIYEDYVWMSTPAKSTKEEAGEGMGSDGGVEVGKQSKFIEIQV